MNRSRRMSHDYTKELQRAMRRYLPTRGLSLIAAGKRWTDRLLVMTMLLVVFSSLGTLAERFAEARATAVKMYDSRRRPGSSYAGFIGQLVRHSARLLALVTTTLRARVQATAGDCWKIGRHLVFGVDGTKSDAPRTRANQEGLKIGGKRKSGPQQLLVTLLHVGTGLPWSWRRGQATDSERALLLEQLRLLPAGALLVADAGFVGYEFLRTILGKKFNVLVRAGANVQLLKNLGWAVEDRGNDVVYVWPERARKRGEEPLVLRRIMVVDGRNRRMCLLTNLSAEELTLAEACEIYRRRWGIEVFFRGLKQTLGRRKMLSDAPENAGVELDWTMVGYWLLGLLLWEKRAERRPAAEGLAWALRLVRAAMAGRGDRRESWAKIWQSIRVDRYLRRTSKKARDWSHKKNDPPCGLPQVRMASPTEKRRAKALSRLKQAA
jgi:Transposase DDE domain